MMKKERLSKCRQIYNFSKIVKMFSNNKMFQLECKIIALDSEKRPLAEKVIKKIKLRAKKKKTFLFRLCVHSGRL